MVRDVARGLFVGHAVHGVAQRDPLVERGEGPEFDPPAQCRLSDEQAGERRVAIHFAVRQEPELFELVGSEEVRLVEHDGAPTPRTERCRACPHGLRPPPHGQTSSPANRRRSTSSASLPTMTTGASIAPSNGPPVRPRNGEGRCATQNVIRLSSHTKKGHPKAAPVTIIATSAAPPPPHRQAGCRSTPPC